MSKGYSLALALNILSDIPFLLVLCVNFLSLSPNPYFLEKLFRKISQNFPPSFSLPEYNLGKLLVNERKNRNGTCQYPDLNNNQHRLMKSSTETLSLKHVGKSSRYESFDCGMLFLSSKYSNYDLWVHCSSHESSNPCFFKTLHCSCKYSIQTLFHVSQSENTTECHIDNIFLIIHLLAPKLNENLINYDFPTCDQQVVLRKCFRFVTAKCKR